MARKRSPSGGIAGLVPPHRASLTFGLRTAQWADHPPSHRRPGLRDPLKADGYDVAGNDQNHCDFHWCAVDV